jgi:hypothetical protein
MAEMLIQSESLTAIADKIRVLSGTTNAMGLDAMETHVDEANTNVSTEADLIARISSALEGKAVSGGGGSGGGNGETCNVTFYGEVGPVGFTGTRILQGTPLFVQEEPMSEGWSCTCPKNSFIVLTNFYNYATTAENMSISGGAVAHNIYNDGYIGGIVFIDLHNATDQVTITIK